MSKHKHFHGIKSGRQMLQHGRREGFGPLSRGRPKKKETAADAANIDGGKAEQKSSKLLCSALSLPKDERECQV